MQHFITDGPTEIEAKWSLSSRLDVYRIRRRLRRLGAEPQAVRRETDIYLDNSSSLRKAGALLRVRMTQESATGLVTFKGPPEFEHGLKKRRETEVAVAEVYDMLAIFGALGYHDVLTYTKRREPWNLAGVEILFDTVPAGLFCEIEGPAELVRETATRLKLNIDISETRDYRTIVEQYFENQAV